MINNCSEIDYSVYSYHTFMFPFRWENEPIDVENHGWKYQKFDISESCEAYNEYHYFHEFVQRTLYNDSDSVDRNDPSSYFEKKEYENQKFEFTIRVDQNTTRSIDLIIDGVSLRTFETGVAVLSINLKNIEHRRFDDVLVINDFGRRLYPQFLANPKNENYADEVQNAFYPLDITFGSMVREDLAVRSISRFQLPTYITDLIGVSTIKPLLDDRMFVISHVMDSALSAALKHDYLDNEQWYKYVYVDSKSLSCQNSSMRKNALSLATYDRWSDYGTLYGITRYSFVCVSDDSKFSHDVINQHIRRHYYQMMNLTLAIRASIIRFSNEVSTLSTLKSQELSDKVSDFYKRYIQFVNRMYFREVSPHEQGIELYTKVVDVMQVEKSIKDLDEEIAELFQYAEMKRQAELNEHMANISERGIPLMIAGIITGIFGMNTIDYDDVKGALQYLIAIGSILLIVMSIKWYKYILLLFFHKDPK